MLTQIGIGVVMFTAIVMALVVVILLARSFLVPSGEITISINNDPDKSVTTSAGGKLLGVLGSHGIFVPSACGGKGTCATCKLQVVSGGGDILPTERDFMTRKEVRGGMRLSCQVAVKQDMKIVVPAEIFDIKKWECTVESNENVATFIKELVLRLPEGEDVNFRAGGYIQIECPPHQLTFRDFDIQPEYQTVWDKYNVWR